MSLFASEWVFFEACGFVLRDLDIDPEIDGIIETKDAPNIVGFWIRKRQIAAIVDWKHMKGPHCSSLFVIGTSYEIHVIGTVKEVLGKLRQ